MTVLRDLLQVSEAYNLLVNLPRLGRITADIQWLIPIPHLVSRRFRYTRFAEERQHVDA